MIILLGLLLFCGHWAEGADIVCDPLNQVTLPLLLFPSGNIVSPGFQRGLNYSSEIVCKVVFIGLPGTYIRVKFNTIDIEVSSGCRNDFLAFVEVSSDSTTIVSGTFCGNNPIADLISGSQNMVLHFQSNHVKTGRGFNISYEVSRTKNLCQEGEFRCRNRKCLSNVATLMCNGHDDCGDGTDEELCGHPVPPSLKCGSPEIAPILSEKLMDRVVGGREARPGSWPWQVDMQKASVEPNAHFCGGTLINAQWFITAAHCFLGPKLPHEIRIHLGNHHKFIRDPYEQIRYIKEYFIYGMKTSDFLQQNEYIMEHDLAVVKLNAPVEFNSAIQPACLPLQGEELPVGKKCFASGWGETRGSGSDEVLKQVEQPVQNEAACYGGPLPFNNKTMICGGRMDILNGLCHGDSGGPLVCQKADGRWHVYGATSFGTETNMVNGFCGFANLPTIFTKLSAKLDDIISVLSNN